MLYEAFAHRLVALDRHRDTGNTLYVRPSPALEQRLRKHQRRGWSVFPFEQAALTMIPAECTENFQSFAELSTFSPVANKRGATQAGAYDDD